MGMEWNGNECSGNGIYTMIFPFPSLYLQFLFVFVHVRKPVSYTHLTLPTIYSV